MKRIAVAVGSLLAGVIALVAVGVSVTAALDPYVWPSALLGLPAGIVAGAGVAALVYLGAAYWTVRDDGERAPPARRRLHTGVAAVGGFVVGGGLATAVLLVDGAGIVTATITGGLPAGVATAAAAAWLTVRRGRTDAAGRRTDPE